MSTEHALRDYARGKFQELYPGKSIKAKNAELAIYNWAVSHTENGQVMNKNRYETEMPSWENALFRWRYKQRLMSVLFNIKNNPEMLKVKPRELETLMPGQMWPEGPQGQMEKKIREKETKMEMAKAKTDAEYEGILTCPKCKSKKTSYYQMQTRSADEVSFPLLFVFLNLNKGLTILQPATNFCSCLCGHRWRFC